jgi:hypothetical protein
MTGALHFVLQFVEQPAELGRVLLGAREFDRPIIRPAEIGVQEAVQVYGCALEPCGAPCEARPRHAVVFLFHRFWFFLILAGLCAVGAPSGRPGTQQLNAGTDHQLGSEVRFLGHLTRRAQLAIEDLHWKLGDPAVTRLDEQALAIEDREHLDASRSRIVPCASAGKSNPWPLRWGTFRGLPRSGNTGGIVRRS